MKLFTKIKFSKTKRYHCYFGGRFNLIKMALAVLISTSLQWNAGAQVLGPGTYTSSLDPENAIQLHWGSFEKKNEGLQSYRWIKGGSLSYQDAQSQLIPRGFKGSKLTSQSLNNPFFDLKVYKLDESDPDNPKKGSLIYHILYEFGNNGNTAADVDDFGFFCRKDVRPIIISENWYSQTTQNSAKIKAIMKDKRVLSKHDRESLPPGWGLDPEFPTMAIQVVDEYQKVVVELEVEHAEITEIAIPSISQTDLANFIHEAKLTQLKEIFENPKDYDYTFIAAHRGYWAEAGVPENTIDAFHRGFEIGADLIEIDVRLTSDDVPVACHDGYLYRLYDAVSLAATKGVAEEALTIGMITAAEFTALNPKDRFGTIITTIKPNTLEEILIEFNHHLVSLDVKDLDDKESNDMRWSEGFKICLQLAESMNLLDNIIIKGLPKMEVGDAISLLEEINMTFHDFYFTPVMFGRYLSDHTPIIVDPIYEDWKPYWLDGSVKSAECVFKVLSDPLLLGGYNDWLHNHNIRIGTYIFYADVPTGITSMEPDGTLQIREYDPDIHYYEDVRPSTNLIDNRGNLDWVMEQGKPNYLIHDRPDMIIEMLKAFGTRNLTKKTE